MIRLGQDADATRLADTLRGLRDLVAELDGCSGFHHGPNHDFEGKSVGFDAGFTLDAVDAIALATYADHPTHKRLGPDLVSLCAGGADGIMVFDIEMAP